MCNTLNVPKSSYFSWVSVDHHAKESVESESREQVITAFEELEGNAGTRGIKGYLQKKRTLII